MNFGPYNLFGDHDAKKNVCRYLSWFSRKNDILSLQFKWKAPKNASNTLKIYTFPKNVWRYHFVRYSWEKIFSSSKCRNNFLSVDSNIVSQCFVNSPSLGKPGKNIPLCRNFGRFKSEHKHQNVCSASPKTMSKRAAMPLIPWQYSTSGSKAALFGLLFV